jgi:SAM-dependent methyltransferase
MLEVAARKDGASIEWIAGDACALKIHDRQFDLVLCQHGLQFFPDRHAALVEMRRLLKLGGRLLANVWRPIEHNAGHHVLADVLERRVGKEAAATRRAPFRFSLRDEIRTVVAAAGFKEIVIEIAARVVRFPSAEGMIRIMMAGTPLAAEMAKADAAVLDSVVRETTEQLAGYEDDRGLAIPMQAWVVTARV